MAARLISSELQEFRESSMKSRHRTDSEARARFELNSYHLVYIIYVVCICIYVCMCIHDACSYSPFVNDFLDAVK